MEKAKARYILYSKDTAASVAQGRFSYLDLDAATEQAVRAELAGWVVRNSCS